MAKIVVDEFDVAHKFVDEIVCFLLPLEIRKYTEISHVVGCSDFVIFVSFNKKNFGGEIRNVSSYGWKVHRPLIEETKNQNCYRFTDRFNICFTAKKKKCLHYTQCSMILRHI